MAAKRLSKMIEDLLKLSRNNTNALSLETVSFNDVLTPVLENLELSVFRTKAEIECDNPELLITADVGLFEQVLQNLIANAIKFTKPDNIPEINIRLTENESSVEIIIEDQGIGLDQSHAKRIVILCVNKLLNGLNYRFNFGI